jgi:hypothetical protein
MIEQKAWEGLPDPLPKVKRAAELDRNIMEKGTRAFVSYVRGYREHQVCTAARMLGACVSYAHHLCRQGQGADSRAHIPQYLASGLLVSAIELPVNRLLGGDQRTVRKAC